MAEEKGGPCSAVHLKGICPRRAPKRARAAHDAAGGLGFLLFFFVILNLAASAASVQFTALPCREDEYLDVVLRTCHLCIDLCQKGSITYENGDCFQHCPGWQDKLRTTSPHPTLPTSISGTENPPSTVLLATCGVVGTVLVILLVVMAAWCAWKVWIRSGRQRSFYVKSGEAFKACLSSGCRGTSSGSVNHSPSGPAPESPGVPENAPSTALHQSDSVQPDPSPTHAETMLADIPMIQESGEQHISLLVAS